jgi:hypothetical protein
MVEEVDLGRNDEVFGIWVGGEGGVEKGGLGSRSEKRDGRR